ncbi:hypothetical protein ADL19_19275 [Streptomyces purpurogeneiscleroticus]|nr:hypothetical protein ADL19_19275 [Streptomyces purpurogeneiscleroticus]
MDLTPFFHNVERIATALETIARNTTPNTYEATGPLLREIATARGPRIDTAGTEGRTLPKGWTETVSKEEVERLAGFSVLPKPLVVPEVTPEQASAAHGQILGLVKRIYDDGTRTANGIAVEMRKRGIPHPRGIQWNNLSAKHFMDALGLVSPYRLRGGRKAKDTAPAPQPAESAPEPDPDPSIPTSEPSPAAENRPPEPAPPVKAGPEPAPEPPEPVAERRVNRAFVEREFRAKVNGGEHMNMRSLLSPKTRASLEAHEKAQDEQRKMIEAAIAAGKVTTLPACTDSNGHVHGEQGCTIRPNGTGAFLGSLGPSANGARTRRVGSGQ